MKNSVKKIVISLTALPMALLISCSEGNDDETPDVMTGSVTSITPTTAVCDGTVTSGGGSPWVNRGICWSNIITFPAIDDKVATAAGGGDAGTFSVALNKLTPGTKYFIRAFAENSEGISYGDTVNFITIGSVTGPINFNPDKTYGSVTDFEGNSYKTIEIGNQTWMAENLKTVKFNDGGEIPEVAGLMEWVNLSGPGFSYYLNNREKYKSTFGALYNWNAVKTGKLCPEGWHVPGASDWTLLISYLGGGNGVGMELIETGTAHWISTNFGITNSTGFTALPGGMRQGTDDFISASYYEDMGYSGFFWTSSELEEAGEEANAWGIQMAGGINQWALLKTQGNSVRCLKD